jgi:sugar phosphate isomerase/epimerase
MKIGIFTPPYQDKQLDETLDILKGLGAQAAEIGTGGYPGSQHCPVDELLESASLQADYLEKFESRGMIISAFSCHYEPLSPDKSIAEESDVIFKKTVRLAKMMNVPVVNVLSGLPAGAPGDTMPNWVTCPWPPHFLDILKYQWDEVGIPYWKQAEAFARDHGVKIGVEMHPGMLLYNVDTLLRMRAETGPNLGANFDPSHLFWNGVDPVAAVRALGDAIFHVHGKDSYVDHLNISVNGCNDHKPYGQIPDRSWTFRAIGYGHDTKVWKDIVSALRMVGYDYVISIEHEDALMSFDEGIRKGMSVLQEAVTFEQPGEMFWA